MTVPEGFELIESPTTKAELPEGFEFVSSSVPEGFEFVEPKRSSALGNALTAGAQSAVRGIGEIVGGAPSLIDPLRGQPPGYRSTVAQNLRPTNDDPYALEAYASAQMGEDIINALHAGATNARESGKAISDLANYYQPDPEREGDIATQAARVVGGIVPNFASPATSPVTFLGQILEGGRQAALDAGDDPEVAEAKATLTTIANAPLAFLPMAKLPVRSGAGIAERIATRAAYGAAVNAAGEAGAEKLRSEELNLSNIGHAALVGFLFSGAHETINNAPLIAARAKALGELALYTNKSFKTEWTPEEFSVRYPEAVRNVASGSGSKFENDLVREVNGVLQGVEGKRAYATGKKTLPVTVETTDLAPRAWTKKWAALADLVKEMQRTEITVGAPEAARPVPTQTPLRLTAPTAENAQAPMTLVAQPRKLPPTTVLPTGQTIPLPGGPKPLPTDVGYIYSQEMPDGRTVHYYQMDRTPENPRGRTVDNESLAAEGYAIEGLPDAVIVPEVVVNINEVMQPARIPEGFKALPWTPVLELGTGAPTGETIDLSKTGLRSTVSASYLPLPHTVEVTSIDSTVKPRDVDKAVTKGIGKDVTKDVSRRLLVVLDHKTGETQALRVYNTGNGPVKVAVGDSLTQAEVAAQLGINLNSFKNYINYPDKHTSSIAQRAQRVWNDLKENTSSDMAIWELLSKKLENGSDRYLPLAVMNAKDIAAENEPGARPIFDKYVFDSADQFYSLYKADRAASGKEKPRTRVRIIEGKDAIENGDEDGSPVSRLEQAEREALLAEEEAATDRDEDDGPAPALEMFDEDGEIASNPYEVGEEDPFAQPEPETPEPTIDDETLSTLEETEPPVLLEPGETTELPKLANGLTAYTNKELEGIRAWVKVKLPDTWDKLLNGPTPGTTLKTDKLFPVVEEDLTEAMTMVLGKLRGDVEIDRDKVWEFYRNWVPAMQFSLTVQPSLKSIGSRAVTTGPTLATHLVNDYEPMSEAPQVTTDGEGRLLIKPVVETSSAAAGFNFWTAAEHLNQDLEKNAEPRPLPPKELRTSEEVRGRAQEVIDELMKVLPGSAKTTTVGAIWDLPQVVYDAALASGVDPARMEGFTYRGEVYVLAHNLETKEDVRRVFFHEQVGHLGINRLMAGTSPSEWNELRDTLKQYSGGALWDTIAANYAGGDDIDIAREVMARLSENMPKHRGIWSKLIDLVRTWLAKLGFTRWGPAEIDALLRRSGDLFYRKTPVTGDGEIQFSQKIKDYDAAVDALTKETDPVKMKELETTLKGMKASLPEPKAPTPTVAKVLPPPTFWEKIRAKAEQWGLPMEGEPETNVPAVLHNLTLDKTLAPDIRLLADTMLNLEGVENLRIQVSSPLETKFHMAVEPGSHRYGTLAAGAWLGDSSNLILLHPETIKNLSFQPTSVARIILHEVAHKFNASLVQVWRTADYLKTAYTNDAERQELIDRSVRAVTPMNNLFNLVKEQATAEERLNSYSLSNLEEFLSGLAEGNDELYSLLGRMKTPDIATVVTPEFLSNASHLQNATARDLFYQWQASILGYFHKNANPKTVKRATNALAQSLEVGGRLSQTLTDKALSVWGYGGPQVKFWQAINAHGSHGVPLRWVLPHLAELQGGFGVPELLERIAYADTGITIAPTSIGNEREMLEAGRGDVRTAYYDEATKTLRISRSPFMERAPKAQMALIVHEALHAVTARSVALAANNNAKQREQRLTWAPNPQAKRALKRAFEAGDRLIKLHKQVMDAFRSVEQTVGTKLTAQYGLSSPYEFAVAVVTDPAVQKLLAGTKLPDVPESPNAWNIFVDDVMFLVSDHPVVGHTQGIANETLGGLIDATLALSEHFSHEQLLTMGGDPGRPLYAPPDKDGTFRHLMEQNIATTNTIADLYLRLFKKDADSAQIEFQDYVTKTLGLKDIFAAKNRYLLELQRMPRPVEVNRDLRLETNVDGQKIVNPVVRNLLLDRSFLVANKAYNTLVANVEKIAENASKIAADRKDAEDRAARYRTALEDTMEMNREVLKSQREMIKEARQFLAAASNLNAPAIGYVSVLKNVLGLEATDPVPPEHLTALKNLLDDAEHSTLFIDALTAASKLDNIDWQLDSSVEIKQKLLEPNPTGTLTEFLTNDPRGEAGLAGLIYYGRQNPHIMLALSVKAMAAGVEKTAAINAIKEIVSGGKQTMDELVIEMAKARRQTGRVAKAKAQYRNFQIKALRFKRAEEKNEVRLNAMNKAIPKLAEKLAQWKKEKGIRQPFEYREGVTVYHPPSPTATAEAVLATAKPIESTEAGFTSRVMGILIDGLKWVEANKTLNHDLVYQISDQNEVLTKLFQDEKTIVTRNWRIMSFLEPDYDLAVSSGLPSARRMGARLRDHAAKRQQGTNIGLFGAQVAVAMKKFLKATRLDYDAARTQFFTPGMAFIEHHNDIISDAPDRATGLAEMKQALRVHFLQTEPMANIAKSERVFDLLWDWLLTNDEAGKRVAKTAADWGVLVRDTRAQVRDARTGNMVPVYRPAMEQGIMTGQRSARKIGEIVHLLSEVVVDGKRLWIEALNRYNADGTVPTPEVLQQMLTNEVKDLFVRPYIEHSGYIHFPAPKLAPTDDTFKAMPSLIQQAWADSDGTWNDFVARLFQLELPADTPPELAAQLLPQYQQDMAKVLMRKFDQIKTLFDSSQESSKLGLETVPHQIMDARMASDLPPEFVEYMLYDEHTMQAVLMQLAAHSALGRNLGLTTDTDQPEGGFYGDLRAVEEEIKRELKTIDLEYSKVRLKNPIADRKTLDAAVEKIIGKPRMQQAERFRNALTDLLRLDNNIRGLFMAPGGFSKDARVGQELITTIVSGMLQRISGAIYQTSQLFEPLVKMGMTKEGAAMVGRNLKSFYDTGAGMFSQTLMRGIANTDRYDRMIKGLDLIHDPANAKGWREVVSDTGRNNAYNRDMYGRSIGLLRKGRGILFGLSFRGGTEASRVFPAFRPLAPFTTASYMLNWSSIKTTLISFDHWLDQAIEYFHAGRMETDLQDPEFKFEAKHLGMSKHAFEEVVTKFHRLGTSLEAEARKAIINNKKPGDLHLTEDLARKAAALAMEELSIEAGQMNTPSGMKNTAAGRLFSPLLTWPVGKFNKLFASARTPEGEASWAHTRMLWAAILFGLVPMHIIVSLVGDLFDRIVLRKQSNLAEFTSDPDNPNFANQNAVALMERLSRTGTFGLAGDVINGVRVAGTDGDVRGISFDGRVVFMSALMSTFRAASNVVHQNGTLTYPTFYRPLLQSLGGGWLLQDAQILNTLTRAAGMEPGLPFFTQEDSFTKRINVNNIVRAQGRALGYEVRKYSGGGSTSSESRAWVGNMVMAVYKNDSTAFWDSYRRAVVAARRSGMTGPGEAEQSVLRSFQGQHPLKSSFANLPTEGQVQRLLNSLDNSSRSDVISAISLFNQYLTLIKGRAITGTNEKKSQSGTRNRLPAAYQSNILF